MKIRRGFTLIELLVAVSIFSIIALCLYSAFSGGIRVWRKQQEGFIYGEGTRLVLERMAKELRNTINYSLPQSQTAPAPEETQGLQFTGQKDTCSFMTIIEGKIAKVTYIFAAGDEKNEGQGGVLKRTVVFQKDGFKGNPKEDTVLKDVHNLSFEYAYEGSEKDSLPAWKDSWTAEDKDTKDNIPIGVRIILEFKKSGAKQNETETEVVRKTVFIPQGTAKKQEGL